MNHPEHREVIVFDDNVFEVEDIVEVTLETQMEPEVGRIMEIMRDGLNLDTSKRYHRSSVFCQYQEIANIKSLSD